MKITNEEIEQVAQAMWDSNPDADQTPPWDKLLPTDEGLKQEIRKMAKAGIRKWLQLTQKKNRMMQCAFDDEFADVRVLAQAEGWSMARRKDAMPFVRRTSELRPIGSPVDFDYPPAGAEE